MVLHFTNIVQMFASLMMIDCHCLLYWFVSFAVDAWTSVRAVQLSQSDVLRPLRLHALWCAATRIQMSRSATSSNVRLHTSTVGTPCAIRYAFSNSAFHPSGQGRRHVFESRGYILRTKRAENFLYPPLLASGGYKWKLLNEKTKTRNIVKKTSCIIHKHFF